MRQKRFSFLKLAFLWIVAVLVIFGGYELVERFWLPREDMRLLHALHILRGIGSSALTALLVGIYLIRRRPATSILGDSLSYPPAPVTDTIRRQSLWFVHMRWGAVALATVGVVYACRLSDLLPGENFASLLGGLTLLALANVYFTLRSAKTKTPYRLIIIQTITDLVALTFLLHFSGGVENPFFLIYVFHVILAGIILSRKDAIFITVLTCLLFVGLAGAEFFHLVSHSYIGLFPHGHGRDEHAAYDFLFVIGRILPFLLVLGITSFFTVLLRDQVRKDETRIVQAGKFAAIGELAGRIAHEINNPIGIISTKTKLLLEDNSLSKRTVSSLEKIEKHSSRIAELTKGLLTFSRPSLEVRFRIDLNRVVESSLSLVEWGEAAGVIRIEKSLEPFLPPMKGNTNEIQEVILNLVHNALDAMPQGGTLSVQTRQEEKELLLTISDTGIGIPEKIIGRIFDPFFTNKENGQGTGLGLSIVDGLVRSHGGWIEVRSLEGKGTSFLIHFPSLLDRERADA